MTIEKSKLLERAENAKRESRYLDFKREFDIGSAGAWCEVIKDVVAFANSGGGIVVFGVNNDGTSSDSDLTKIIGLDMAVITDKIRSYTDHQFSDIEIVEIARGSTRIAALVIGAAEVPMIFTRPGTYDAGGGKQKSAFAQGTIYFRHGAKSAPEVVMI